MEMEKHMSEKAPSGNGGSQIPSEQPVSVLAPPGLVSILIPCVGQLEYTKLLVPSLLQHSRPPFELIFLDIGSLDGTAEYLAGLAAAASHLRLEVVRTPTDMGVPSVVGQALSLARGEFLVLLNNDCVVTAGWLNQLIALASAKQTIGMVGPMSNYAAPPQLVETVPYRLGPKKGASKTGGAATGDFLVDVSAVHKFASEFREKHKGKWIEVERLGGFCLLLERQVLKKIEQTSSLRERTDLGLFDTDILSMKARQAGFTLACCRDLFIHHFGSRIFAHGAPASAREANNS
jgi:GT2 family glycosyltransferase